MLCLPHHTRLAFSLLVLTIVPAAFAQTEPRTVVPDTLDWQRYFPLQEGNVWEYRESEGFPLVRREIVGDTVFGDRSYFIVREKIFDRTHSVPGYSLELWGTRTRFARYDSSRTLVMVHSIAADTVRLPHPIGGLDGEVTGLFDLSASFGDSIQYGPGPEDFYLVDGGYAREVEIGDETYTVDALKQFSTILFANYAADIGLLSVGNLWGPRLTYARVGGREYGTERYAIAVDTLDWHDYYPLQLGNVWEYRIHQALVDPYYVRREIVGDSLIDGTRYFIQQERRISENHVVLSDTLYLLRYDEDGRRIAQWIGSDQEPNERSYLGACDLGASFNTTVACPEGGVGAVAGSPGLGDVVVKGDTMRVPATKRFGFYGSGARLAHGISEIGGTDLSIQKDTRLVYIRVNGQVYGESFVETSAEDDAVLPTSFSRVAVYPNPAVSTLTLEYALPAPASVTVEVFDLLGRKVMSIREEALAPGDHKSVLDVSRLPAGVYLLRVSSGDNRVTRKITVIG